MNNSALYGLLTLSFVTATLLATPFKTLKYRLFATVTLFVCLLFPLASHGYCLAYYLFSLTDTVSISLVFYAVWMTFIRKQIFSRRDQIVFTVIGSALLLSELGYIPIDIYCWGYHLHFPIIFTCFLILLLPFTAPEKLFKIVQDKRV